MVVLVWLFGCLAIGNNFAKNDHGQWNPGGCEQPIALGRSAYSRIQGRLFWILGREKSATGNRVSHWASFVAKLSASRSRRNIGHIVEGQSPFPKPGATSLQYRCRDL